MKKILFIIALGYIAIKNNFGNTSYNLEDLNKKNSDVIGIIKIPGTNINYPVLKGENNDFYLNHDINKKKNSIGSVFMDYRNNILDNQINIYAHSSNVYNAPFNELLNYLKKDTFINYKKINFTTINETYNYLIYSCIITNDNVHMKINSNNVEYIKHLQYFKDNSIYNVNLDLDQYDKIIVLQTCLLEDKSYLLVVGRLIN